MQIRNFLLTEAHCAEITIEKIFFVKLDCKEIILLVLMVWLETGCQRYRINKLEAYSLLSAHYCLKLQNVVKL